jgi:uncharacterized protein (UPF0276 family)
VTATGEPLGVGFVLHPNAEYLELCASIIEERADFFEVSPETLWQIEPNGHFRPSSWSDVMDNIRRESGRPMVAHGLGLSPGTAAPGDMEEEQRLQRWLERIRLDQERFNFCWYTEHLGWASAGGQVAVLPLPLPPTDEAVQTVADRLNRLRPIIPWVGFENQVSYFAFGDVCQEGHFWNRICTTGDLWLLLDLHNCYTQSVNFGVPLDQYLAGIDLSRVLEIHVSGGSDSEASWLPSGRVMRLDAHDGPVPEPVWTALERVRPRCPNLRGVVVERLQGTLAPDDVPLLEEEVRRAHRIFWGR